MRSFRQRLAVIAGRLTPTNTALARAAERLGIEASVLTADEACKRLGAGDVALARLDVLPALDGVEPGLWDLRLLEQEGVRVLNSAGTLLMAHDKLMTALRLAAEGLPHPRTAHVDDQTGFPELETPVVVKPRFGSWGRDVVLCRNRRTFRRCLRRLGQQPWFRRQGALVQELVEPRGHDLRVIVARGEVVGAVERVAAKGEWRTNVALGGRRRATAPTEAARGLAVAAAGAIGADLVGVDLLPDGEGGYVVLELNGAVDFNEDYALNGQSVFDRAARALMWPEHGEEADPEEALARAVGARR